MSVIKGEGSVPILFGTRSVTAGAVTHETYLARPDLSGEWPTVVIVPSGWGLTSSIKDVARRLARHGVAAIVVDVYRGAPPSRAAEPSEVREALVRATAAGASRAVADVIGYVRNSAGFWSNAEDGLAVLGVGDGGSLAIDAALAADSALVLVASMLSPDRAAALTEPFLGIVGRDDEVVSDDDIAAARAAAPHGEWVIYDGVGQDFLDDHRDGFDLNAYEDAVERIAAFCEKHLPIAG